MKTEVYKGKKVSKSLMVFVVNESNGKESTFIESHGVSNFEMVGIGEFIRFRGLVATGPIPKADKKEEKDA